MDAVEQRTIAKVSRRLLPVLMLGYFAAYLDRVNLSFGALQMNKELGFSASVFGFGAGIFFLGYFVFEVPSNLALERFGARKWIARIMLSWGLLSGGMAFVTGETGFYVMRVLLGAAEAGFFPGIIFYLTLWFPASYRGRVTSLFVIALPLSVVIGAPVSGLIFSLDGALGLRGWQWLFIIEAIPTLILSVVIFFYLTDLPSEAGWLSPEERDWLVARLDAERRQRESAQSFSVLQALYNPKVLGLAATYFGVSATSTGIGYFLPQIVRGFGLSYLQTTLVTAIPYLVGLIGMLWYGRRSDRRLERRSHTAVALLVAAIGIGVSTILDQPVLKILAFCVAGFGVYGALAVFWSLPTAMLSGPAAAAGIAVINSLGNLAGFVGPYTIGVIKDATGSYTGGLMAVSYTVVLGVIVLLGLHHDPALERPPPARSDDRASEAVP